MTETYEALKPFLPTELVGYLNELHRRVQSKSKQAWEFLKDNPEAEGIPVSNFLDWLEASACVTFLQYMEDGKIKPVDEQDVQETQTLLDVAGDVVSAFAEKYQDAASIMRPQNFVINYIEIAKVKFSTIDPFNLCVLLEFDPKRTAGEIDAALTTQDWLSIKEIDPEYYDVTRKAVAKAFHWAETDSPNLAVIPIEVARDVFMLKRLADKVTFLQKDIKELLDSNGSEKAFNTLESILRESFHDFASRLTVYKTTVIHTDMHLATLQISMDYSGSPKEIIEKFGPGCFCVPWLVEQEIQPN